MAASPFASPDQHVICVRCGKPVYVSNSATFMRSYGAYLSLRCQAPDCGFIDWYGESEVIEPQIPPSMSARELPVTTF